MLSDEQIENFRNDGYLIVPNILTSDEVSFLRNRITTIFNSDEWKKSVYNTAQVLSDVYNTFPEFIDITINEKIISIVKSLLGEKPVLMPETAIHYQFYTGWHKDTTSQERAGNTFHKKPESLMIEAGFYLQDNDEYGGGLTVMQGSHNSNDVFKDTSILDYTISDRIKNKLGIYKEEKNKRINPNNHKIVDIKSKAGDLVIFNFKTNHRATRPLRCAIADIPADKKKIAFFNAYSINNTTANEYLNYIYSRKEPFYEYLKNRVLINRLIEKSNELKFKCF
jgi:ectoine hydroxylase-related dioxygenase (phytanoyl-CoA dioxygenase family)